MSDQTSTTSRTLLPALANYDALYAEAITRMSEELTEDEKKPWSFANADGAATGELLTVTASRITPLKERYLQLKRTSNNLLFIAQIWMHDASKRTRTELEEERQKYQKLRDDHHAQALEERSLERLVNPRQAINGAVEEYNDQWTNRKWPENHRPRLKIHDPLSKLEAAVHERCNADQSDQSNAV